MKSLLLNENIDQSWKQCMRVHWHLLNQSSALSFEEELSYIALDPKALTIVTFLQQKQTQALTNGHEIQNQCPYTVWAAAVPGGGRRLEGGQSWTINANP